MAERALILTLKLDAAAFERLEALRREHFPAGLNHIPAHLTLFHHLPGESLGEVVDDLTAAPPPVMPLRVSGLRKLGRGVAYEIDGRELKSWRGELAQRWAEWLTSQDRQPFRPHVTVQNKVEPLLARDLHDRLQASFQPFDLRGEGVFVWRYLGGPWALEAEVAFRRAA